MNLLADAFSSLLHFSYSEVMEGKDAATLDNPEPMDMMQFTELYECLWELPEMDNYFAVSYHMLNLPSSGPNPLDLEWLCDTQDTVPRLRHQCDEGISGFSKQSSDGVDLICFTDNGSRRK